MNKYQFTELDVNSCLFNSNTDHYFKQAYIRDRPLVLNFTVSCETPSGLEW